MEAALQELLLASTSVVQHASADARDQQEQQQQQQQSSSLAGAGSSSSCRARGRQQSVTQQRRACVRLLDRVSSVARRGGSMSVLNSSPAVVEARIDACQKYVVAAFAADNGSGGGNEEAEKIQFRVPKHIRGSAGEDEEDADMAVLKDISQRLAEKFQQNRAPSPSPPSPPSQQ